MSNEKRKPFMIFSHGMMRYLDGKGFKFFATTQNRKDPTKTVFIYDNTDELLEAINNYKAN